MARRNQSLVTLLIIAASTFLGVTFIWQFRNQPEGTRHPALAYNVPSVDQSVLSGSASAPKLENATLKAELGRSAWHLLHTTMSKFPDKPTESDSEALKSYVYLFARLYPCGDCARHFQSILKEYPPQVGSRVSAATWACHVHNEVNDSLGKKRFDCSKIGDFYDCGCAEDAEEGESLSSEKSRARKEEKRYTGLALEREDGLMRGG